ncbi:hypothetical protein BC567DRAFT_208952 [Phyllosticta citribraziliensis]
MAGAWWLAAGASGRAAAGSLQGAKDVWPRCGCSRGEWKAVGWHFFLHLCTKKLRCRWFCVPRMSWSAATRSTAMNETSKGANRQPPSQQVKHMLHIIHRVKRDDNASSW